jgi:homoserine kinase
MTSVRTIKIKVPASTANIGPGFDVMGISLSLYLTLTATIPAPQNAPGIHITYEGDSPDTVPLQPEKNLITKTALQVAASVHKHLPPSMAVHIENPIPLGRGLGSSGSAVVAGVVLANQAAGLEFSQQRVLDYCLQIEGHPDNVSASLLGGFVASYLRSTTEEEVQDSKVNGVTTNGNGHHHNDTSENPHPTVTPLPLPPQQLSRYVKIPWSSSIKLVVIVPDFELQTKLARSVLPPHYTRPDCVFNLQRLAVLVHSLSTPNPDSTVISEAMQDKIHQNYRAHLVPGLSEILKLTPKNVDGLLGLCMSGAGPTVVALATKNFDGVGKRVVEIFEKNEYQVPDSTKRKKVNALYMVLDVASEGTTVEVL